jgi:hypothetical protein
MAQMFPRKFPDDGEQSERDVFEALSSLSDDWTVLYSVSFKNTSEKRQERNSDDCEIDFLVLNPDLGGFVLEVKGGSEILLRNGDWFSRPHHSNVYKLIKDPFAQAKDNTYAFLKLARQRLPMRTKLPFMTHAVVFPSHTQKGDMGLERPREIICDQHDLLEPLKFFQRVAKFVGRRVSCTAEEINELRQCIRPDQTIPVSPRRKLDSALQQQEALTNYNEELLDSVLENRRFVVKGAAGTGKTILAINSARRLSAQGRKTLLLCFNRPLADHLQSQVRDVQGLTVNSFDGFARTIADTYGWSIEDPEDNPFHILEASKKPGMQFDALVVDEAQDFDSDWWDALLALLAENSSNLQIYADSAQDIYAGSGLERFSTLPQIHLKKNCRNTAEIARCVHRIGRVSATTIAGAVGPSPEFERVRSRQELLEISQTLISRWRTNYELESHHIMVLTDRSDLREWLISERVGSIEDDDGVTVETIHRFKGLEAQAVICAFDPASESPLDNRQLQQLGYVGLSRARTLLAVLGTGNTLSRLRP